MNETDNIVCEVVSDADRERLRGTARGVLANFSWIKAAYLYGSAVRGSHPAHDIDIGLLADPIPAWGQEALVAKALQQATPIHGLPFDVRILNHGDPVFLNNVMKTKVLLFDLEREVRISFEVWAMSSWLDFQPVWTRLRSEVLTRWAHG
jgi:predicted nucleotidyltransferase